MPGVRIPYSNASEALEADAVGATYGGNRPPSADSSLRKPDFAGSAHDLPGQSRPTQNVRNKAVKSELLMLERVHLGARHLLQFHPEGPVISYRLLLQPH